MGRGEAGGVGSGGAGAACVTRRRSLFCFVLTTMAVTHVKGAVTTGAKAGAVGVETCDARQNNWQCLHRESVSPLSANSTLTCASGCAVEQTGKCCESGCCAHHQPEYPSCVPFNLNTMHLVVEGDGSLAEDNHIRLPVGTTVIVACRPGFIVPPSKRNLQGEGTLSCTDAPYARTQLVCVSDPAAEDGLSGLQGHLPGGFGAVHTGGLGNVHGDLAGADAGVADVKDMYALAPAGRLASAADDQSYDGGHGGLGVAVLMVLMLGVVVATVVGKRKLQVSGGGTSDRRRIDVGDWRTSSAGSIGLRVAIGGSAAEISLRSSLVTEGHSMGGDADAYADADLEDAQAISSFMFAPPEGDEDSSSGTEVYTSGDEGTGVFTMGLSR